MKKLINTLMITTLMSCGAYLSVQAQTAAAKTYNVKDFGATGDGQTLDTDPINKAITTAAAAGGGTVYFPAGTYASHSIRLKSHIRLYIDQGATILAAPSTAGGKGYDEPEPNDWGDKLKYQDFGHSHWHNSLIWGENLEDISIMGPGLIYGKGLTRETPRRVGEGNKTIGLKLCRNVILKDFSILLGGHFGMLLTGIDNLTIDNIKEDTNRDGMDIDCCHNVHVSNCSVNTPFDDGICLKSSFALGYFRSTENITITNCQVSGFDRGTFLNGTYQTKEGKMVPDRQGPTGRIKFGTESNGGFKGITISNCVFEHCRGLALETVDGASIEDVTINNITMRDIGNSPLFLRLGARMRGPENTPVGYLRRVLISNVNVYNADSHFSSMIVGIPGHNIEDVKLNNIRIYYRPIDSPVVKIQNALPEHIKDYPEPERFGVLPSYGFFIRHAQNIEMNNVEVSFMGKETRPAVILEDVKGVSFINFKAQTPDNMPAIVQRGVEGFSIQASASIPANKIKKEAIPTTAPDPPINMRQK
ncbi:glycoside hydrolase family 28 protein [Mucilaginibacter mali]|uniref:Glycoside hydrolase family 28 protein n=1 Tax=Mucilaginibacter mali TaxID=2740462 RepID=A0A7D4TWR4_9SPHI|nr:glycosyl hydrolase family 28-related protein [Mucilaginibacter mali]QKJ29757.1 glycoside hydrolase family 28 protein [Mucilaginibacter mali]